MNMKAKIALCGLCVAAILALVGCGSKAEESTPAPAPAATGTTPAAGQTPAATGQPAPPQDTSNQGGEFIKHGEVTL